MIRGIHHTAISTGDLERSVAFYRDLLGFEVVLDYEWPKGTPNLNATHALEETAARVMLLKRGNSMLELFQYQTPTPRPADPSRRLCDHGIIHFCLDIVDIDAEYERLKAAGMRFHCPPVQNGDAKMTYGRDPDGNVIELLEFLNADDPLAIEFPATQAD
jgi:catechol 2,3-dioxygenase-like lactoylglutathione lyase family enzyme